MRGNTKTKETVRVNLYLDTRRQKDNGSYPVRIRVYDALTKKARLYTTTFDLSEKDFGRIFLPELGQKLRREEKEIQSDLMAIEDDYREKAEGLGFFTFDEFEKLFTIKRGDQINVLAY